MRILILLLVLLPLFAASQGMTYYIRSDSVKIQKNGGSNELFIQNATRSVPGVLVNVGNGRSAWQRVTSSGDTLFIGLDTVLLDIPAGVTASNGLTAVGSDIRLGGTLTNGTTTIGGAGEVLNIQNIDQFEVSTWDQGVGFAEINITPSSTEIRNQVSEGSGEYLSSINIYPDSIRMRPHTGTANIDSLRSWSAIADTLHKKPMTWDTRNGRWEYLDHWPSGGGGGSGVTTMQAIGASPNANGATISGSDLTLQPASSSFGGVVTTGTQTFAGEKTITSAGGGGSYTLKIFNTNVGSNAMLIGFQNSSNDAGEISYGHIGTNNTANSMNFAMKGAAAFNMTIQGTGNTGIRQTTPTGFLHIGAGTTSEVPFKLTEGSNATTPEDGAIEYTSNNLHFTEGSTRYTLLKTLTSAQAINFTSIAAGGNNQNTVTVTGAAIGDLVMVDQDITETNVIYTAWVSNTDTVTVRAYNSSASPIDPASATFRIVVVKF